MLRPLLGTLMPATHLVLMDHDTCLTCLWEVEELQLAAVTLDHQDEQPPAERNFVWQYSPEGAHSYVPGWSSSWERNT